MNTKLNVLIQNLNASGHMSPSYRNFAPVSMSSVSSSGRRDDRIHHEDRESSYMATLHQAQDHQKDYQIYPQFSEPLNQSAIGTHV